MLAVLDTASASASYDHGAISFTASRVAHIARRSRTSRAMKTAALGAQGLAPEYDLLQLAKLPHSGASVAFVAPCRRAALWLEEGLAANAQSLRPSRRSLCEACVPRWRRRPARPHRRPARPIDRHAVPQSVRRRWMAHRPSLKARHSAQPPRLSLLCLRAIVLAHDLRERSAKQFERYPTGSSCIQEGIHG